MDLRGRATVLPPLAAAIDRWRCRGHPANFAKRGHIHTGAPLGRVSVGLLPAAATGRAGTVTVFPGVELADTGDPAAVAPTGAGTAVDDDGETAVRFALPPGSRVPLACDLGAGCAPSGGAVSLPGGFVVSAGGRSSAVADVAVAWSRTGDEVVATVTGTVDGRPMTLAAGRADQGLPMTADALTALGTALGAEVSGRIGIVTEFTETGPL
jgi:hypothetical protein